MTAHDSCPGHHGRRDFLKSALWTGLGGIALLNVPFGVREALARDAGARWDRTLVVLHLGGGNDGLNTVIPYADPEYRRARPRLALPNDQILQLSGSLGLHNALEPLRALWNNGTGDLGIMLGLGYPRQNRSHFRSAEIWETGSEAEEVLNHGWLGRLFTVAQPPATLPADGVILSGSTQALAAPNITRIVLPSWGDLGTAKLVARVDPAKQTAAVGHTMRTQADLEAAAVAFKGLSKVALPVTFPESSVGRSFAKAAQVILSGKQVPVITLAQGGYDTHAQQANTHRILLRDLAAALTAFRECMIKAGKWNSVAVMTYAEFGRRKGENGSGGTDHGTSAVHFLMGGGVKGGFHGQQPSLTNDLEGGDPRFTTDFRRVYTSVAREFWGMSASTATSAIGSHQPLGLFKSTGV